MASHIPVTSGPTPFGELKLHFGQGQANDLQVLRHCMGTDIVGLHTHQDPAINNARRVAHKLAAHTILICIDIEYYTLNSDEMTEVGIAMVKVQDVASIAKLGNFGEHGENLMQQAKFHFFRFREKVHLPTTNAASKGPEGSHFGEVRFTSFADARAYLHELFVQLITKVAAFKGYNHPVIVSGHAIGHDLDHLNGKDLAFNSDSLGTVVRYIDTQQVAKQARKWLDGSNDIGLIKLVRALDFEHTNAYTAANDFGRTLMCAVLLAIPKDARRGCRRSTEQVAADCEAFSRNSFVGLGGTKLYCSNCRSDQHMADQCAMTGMNCETCVSRDLFQNATTHVKLHCTVVRDEVAAERLAWFNDQPNDPHGRRVAKVPFQSRLQSFAHGAPVVPPQIDTEINARRRWYDSQRVSTEPLKPFVWWRRSFMVYEKQRLARAAAA